MVTIFAADGKEFKISREEAQLSLAWKDEKEVKTTIDSITIGYVVDFLVLHRGVRPPAIRKPLISTEMSENTTRENANFIDTIPLWQVFKLATTSENLEINDLMLLSAAKIGSLIKGLPMGEAREILARLEKGPEKEIEISEKW